MLDIILFLASTLAGMLVGVYLQKRAKQRAALFSDLARYVAALKINVTGKQQELADFNAAFAAECSAPFADCLVAHKWQLLSAAQKKRMEEFFAALDCSGSAQLLQNLEYFSQQFAPDVSETATAAKKSSVYVKLGILLGAMVGILFL